MVKKTKGKHRLDKFYHLAKEQGYRSRAAFKLIQLNRKYDFLSGARTLLDLCAAPGGWCQVAVKNMPVGSLILGVDLAPIKPIRGVKTFIGDITTQKCRQLIRKESGGQFMDIVLHDGAPNVGGAWSSEAYSQSWLVLEALRMATDVLAPKGIFITKVFRSKDYSALLYAMNQLFTKVEATKPAASRNASAEIFVVCQGYKAPARIDPRLLDPKHLFKEVHEPAKAAGPDALLKAKIKQKRFREGYEEGMSTSRKVLGVAAFVMGDAPVEMLGQYTSFALDGDEALMKPKRRKDAEDESEDEEDDDDEEGGMNSSQRVVEFVAAHPATTDEIRLLCKDLQVLGRSEFKQLLKWRLLVKKDLAKQEKKKNEEVEEAQEEENEEQEEGKEKDKASQLEQQLLEEMEGIKDRMERRKKREKRRRRELKVKARVRSAQLAQSEGIGEDAMDGPDALFSLSSLRSKKGVDAVHEADVPSEDDEGEDGDNEQDEESEYDSDEERRRYDAAMDEYLEESYKNWRIRQRMKDAGGGVVKKRRRRLGMRGSDSESEGEEVEDGGESESENEDEEAEEEEEEEEGGGLIVSLDGRRAGRATNAAAVANQWFSQDIFEDEDIGSTSEEEEGVEEEEVAEEEEEDSEEEELEDSPTPATGTAEQSKQKKTKERNSYGFGASDRLVPTSTTNNNNNTKSEKPGFEVVPMSDSDRDSDSDADEFEGLDDDAKAEVRALAKKFLRRKSKEDIMEAAYNRYAFHDEGLPKWFADDEKKFMRPAPQITADEFKAAKDELRAIDARPIKKVAEAKARKRKRLQAKLTQARQKAETIANQEDVPMKAKMREIEKLYAQARSGGNKKKKGGGGAGGGSRSDQYKKKGPPLDKRMKKDKRGLDVAARRAKKRGRPMASPAQGGGRGKKGRGRK